MGDVEFNPENGCITHLIVPGPGCLCGIFGREKEYIIPFQDVCQIGDDIILVEVRKLKDIEKPCKCDQVCAVGRRFRVSKLLAPVQRMG